MPRRSPSPRTILGLGVLLLLAMALGPTRFTGWVTGFRDPFMALEMPISDPMTGLSTWLRPAATTDRFENASEDELTRQAQELERLYLRALDRIEELEALIEDIQRYDQPVRKLEATRVSANLASGTFEVNRGRSHGVIGGTVAVARRSEQLVGLVTSTSSMGSTIHVLTDEGLEPAWMVGIVLPETSVGVALEQERFKSLPRAQFRPAGDGTLVAEEVGADEAGKMKVGDLVRLSDETWPSAASMLILGKVARIEKTDDMLFYRVVVRPLDDVARLRSVILFIPDNSVGLGESDDDGEGGDE